MTAKFDFGNWSTGSDGLIEYLELTYQPCFCRQKYSLKPENKLLEYLLQECKGFEQDPGGQYTLNFILLILITNWSQSDLIWFGRYLKRRPEEIQIIDYDNKWFPDRQDPYFDLRSLRPYIAEKYFLVPPGVETKRFLFYCLDRPMNFITEKLHTSCRVGQAVNNSCIPFMSSLYQLNSE